MWQGQLDLSNEFGMEVAAEGVGVAPERIRESTVAEQLNQASSAWGNQDKHCFVPLFRTGRPTEDLSGDRHAAETKRKERQWQGYDGTLGESLGRPVRVWRDQGAWARAELRRSSAPPLPAVA